MASSTALATADAMLARGLASESRNAAVLSNVHAERAVELEAAARVEEEHEVKLGEASGRLLLDAVEHAFAALDLPVPGPLLRDLLRGAEPEADVLAGARMDVRRVIAGEVRAELIAQAEAERLARRALPAGSECEEEVPVVDAEVVEGTPADDGLPPWSELPDHLKRLRDRDLARIEGARELKSEERRRAEGKPRPSGVDRFPSFRHPGSL
jgi:hypothetical protein